MAEISSLVWTFIKECPTPTDVSHLLLKGEEVKAAYETIRDKALFTNKRLIVRDAQGLTGKKIETYSLPYSSIMMWSTETAGNFLDFSSEVQLWTKIGKIKIHLKKDIDLLELDCLFAEAIL